MANPLTYTRAAATLAASPPFRLLIVCSALAGVTNRLINLWNLKETANDKPVWLELEHLHTDLIEQLLDGRSLAVGKSGLARWIKIQKSLWQDRWDTENALRSEDQRIRFITGGERISSALLTLYLASAASVTCLDASQVLVVGKNPDEGEAHYRSGSLIEKHVRPLLNLYRAVITQGFCASTPSGRLTTLGRGGSDTSATLFARYLRADSVTIWTDTPGVMTTDPRLVPEAETLTTLTYAEAGSLARHGAKVLHEDSMRPLQATGIPVAVLNSFAPDEAGTRIEHEAQGQRFAISHRNGLCLARLEAADERAFSELASQIRRLPALFWKKVIAFDLGASEVRLLLPRESLGWLQCQPYCGDLQIIDGLALLFVLQRDFGQSERSLDDLITALHQERLSPLFGAPAIPLSDNLIALPEPQSKTGLKVLHRLFRKPRQAEQLPDKEREVCK